MTSSQRSNLRVTTLCLALLAALVGPLSGVGRAEEPAPPSNAIHFDIGGQVRFAKYRHGLKLAGGYMRYLSGAMWLDLGGGVIVHKETNFMLDGGVRWKFARTRSGVAAHVRAQGEVAFLFEGSTRVALAGRFGGGMSYAKNPRSFAGMLEAGVAVGPVFGDGVAVAGALDILVGFEFPF